MGIKNLLTGGVVDAAKEAFKSRNERKTVEKTLEAKIAEKKLDNTAQIELSDKEWEHLSKWSEEGTWKDEYVTVSVVSIFNIIVLGGLAAGFGYPQVLNGITIAVMELNSALEGTVLGNIMTVTIFAAIGIYSFNKIFKG